jgi:murein tripeptide amidase MpaA
MYIIIVFICIIFGALTPISYSKPPSDRCILIKVHVADRDDTEALVKMGLDIWEFQQDGAIIRVTDDERKQIKESGFTIETISEDVYEYTEKIAQEQISLLAEPTTAKYHSHDEVVAELKALEDSGVAQTYIIGNTHEGRDIWAVRISDNPSEDEEEPGAIFLGCHHAREWISVEVPLYIAQYLTDNYDTDEHIRHLIDNCQIWIIPVVNPDGYEYSRTIDRMWVKNRRENGDGTFGVDISTNYTHKWGHQTPRKNTSHHNYRGPSAFSEPETCAIRDLAIAYDFRVMMSYHSYGQETIYPWLFTKDPCPDDIQMGAMSFKMRELIKETSGAIYIHWLDRPGADVSSGGMESDWCYGELGVYSFVIELRPIFVTFNLGGFRLPTSQIMPTCLENLPVALYAISYAAADYGIENLTTGQTYNNIQLAINDANDGDEIVVNPGVYHESISFIDKNLTLRSTDPNDPNVVASTVIDIEGPYQGPVITLSGNRDRVYVLDGLTISGGQVNISCCNISPTIKNCIVGSDGTNAIEFWKDYEAPTIIDSTISGQVVEVNDPTLIAYWSLDETEGIVAQDISSDNDANVVGDPVWQPTGGIVDGAIQLDGVDDYISTDYILNPTEETFSVFTWVKGGAPGQVVLSQIGVINWLLADSSEGNLMTELKNSGRVGKPLQSQTNITDGNWHRIGLVCDGLNRTLYVDDIAVAQDTQDNLKGSDSGLYIGTGKSMKDGTYWSGLIDDVRIYNRVVTP